MGKYAPEFSASCLLCPQRPRLRLCCQRDAQRRIIRLTRPPWKRNECAGMSDASNTAMRHRHRPGALRRLSQRHKDGVYSHRGFPVRTHHQFKLSLFSRAADLISEIVLGGRKKRKSSPRNGSALNQNGFLKPISQSVLKSLKSFETLRVQSIRHSV